MFGNMKEKQRMTDKLEDTSLRLKDEMDLYKKMMDKLRQNRNEFQRERDTMQEVSPCAKMWFLSDINYFLYFYILYYMQT